MANLASQYYATDGGAGAKTGLSLADAAAIDPSDPDWIGLIVNAGTLVGDVVITFCAGYEVLINSSCAFTIDATSEHRIRLEARNAANTAAARIRLNAQGAGFKALHLPASDYWTVDGVGGMNTDRAPGNSGVHLGGNADYCTLIRVDGLWAADGIRVDAGAYSTSFLDCYAAGNVYYGIYAPSVSGQVRGCTVHNCGRGINVAAPLVDCLVYDIAATGVYCYSAHWTTVARCASAGIASLTSTVMFACVDTVVVDCAGNSYRTEASSQQMLLWRAADYGCAGRASHAGTDQGDVDDPGITVDPHIEGPPRLVLAAGAGGATAVDDGDNSEITDLSGSGWGGVVRVGDRVRFFAASGNVYDAIEAIVLAVSVGGDDNVITTTRVASGPSKQCWLGGGNFTLNNDPDGGAKIRNAAGRTLPDGNITYASGGALQPRCGRLLAHPGMTGGING